MNNYNNIQDNFIKKIIKETGFEKPSSSFTDNVMSKVDLTEDLDNSPLVSPLAWFGIITGIIILIVTLFTVEIPFINDLFSGWDINNIQFKSIFNGQLFIAFKQIFAGIELSKITLIVILAIPALLVLDKMLRHRITSVFLLM